MESYALLFASTLNAGTVLAIAALGLLINEKAGIVNLCAEGIMLCSAIAGFAAVIHTGSDWFGFLAGMTKKIGFAAGVLILAQRQAALVAKQAASLDALCEGRFRLGVGVGWHEIEFQGLGMDFHTRGVRSAEQVRFMQALWARDGITFKGKYHELVDGGNNPRPKSGKVPVWFGGHAEQTLQRVAK